MYKLSFPKSLSLVFWQLSVWVYSIIGYSLAEGSISAFNYARNVQCFAVSLFGIAVATAVFPFIVDSVEANDDKQIVERTEFALGQILFFTVPAAVGLGLLAVETTNLLFGRGTFDANAVIVTSGILFFFAFSIPFESCVHLLSRVFYAFKNTWIPVGVNLMFLIVNIVTAFSFAKVFGPKVFAISFSIGVILQVVVLLILLRRFVLISYFRLLGLVSKIVLASTIMGFVVYGLKTFIQFNFATYTLCVAAGVLIYFVLAKLLGIISYAGLDRFKFFKK
jgi:putative peptidoglycan lipid II flippase